jgi:diaminopimelate epimerase
MDARFAKMHGLGNDFVVFDERAGPLGITPTRAAALADRRTGIGCDQVICLGRADGATAFMRIYNPDGSEAGACGNATRCVADLLFRASRQRHAVIRTVAGQLTADVLGDGRVVVDMGPPLLGWEQIPLLHACDTAHLELAAGPLADPAACSIGNPHATFFTDDISAVPLANIGAALEHAALFPARANIGVVQVLARDRLRLRVWERGAGLTLACGSGACAAVVNAARRGYAGRECEVVLDGGSLLVAWRADDHVLMTGPSALAFTGAVDLSAYPA